MHMHGFMCTRERMHGFLCMRIHASHVHVHVHACFCCWGTCSNMHVHACFSVCSVHVCGMCLQAALACMRPMHACACAYMQSTLNGYGALSVNRNTAGPLLFNLLLQQRTALHLLVLFLPCAAVGRDLQTFAAVRGRSFDRPLPIRHPWP